MLIAPSRPDRPRRVIGKTLNFFFFFFFFSEVDAFQFKTRYETTGPSAGRPLRPLHDTAHVCVRKDDLKWKNPEGQQLEQHLEEQDEEEGRGQMQFSFFFLKISCCNCCTDREGKSQN